MFIVDCVLSEWSNWSSCPVTCGGDIISRDRQVTVEAAYGGEECSTNLGETLSCGEDPCPGKTYIDSRKHRRLFLKIIFWPFSGKANDSEIAKNKQIQRDV